MTITPPAKVPDGFVQGFFFLLAHPKGFWSQSPDINRLLFGDNLNFVTEVGHIPEPRQPQIKKT